MNKKTTSCFIFGLWIAAIILGLDQASKYILMDVVGVSSGQAMEVLPFFNLVMVWNTGVSFGMLAGHGSEAVTLLTVVTSVIVLVLLEWLRRAEDRTTALALAAIIGGALGNIVDRLRFRAVADFFDFHWGIWHWPAFNIADSAIFLGVVVLAWGSIFPRRVHTPCD